MVEAVQAFRSKTDGRLFNSRREAEQNDIRNRLMSLFQQDAEMVDKMLREWKHIVSIATGGYENEEAPPHA